MQTQWHETATDLGKRLDAEKKMEERRARTLALRSVNKRAKAKADSKRFTKEAWMA